MLLVHEWTYKFVSSLDVVLVSSSSYLMDLECHLLRRSSVCRLRRCAATLPLFLEKTFPSPAFVLSCAESMKGLVWENKFSWARHWNKTCCRRSLCKTSPRCRKCLHSSGASITVTVLKIPVTASCICLHCHRLYCLPPPLLPLYWMDWAAVSGHSSSVERLGGAAVWIHMAELLHWSHRG